MKLRPMRIEDAEPLSILGDDDDVWKFTQRPHARTLEHWRGLIDILMLVDWNFTAEHDGKVVGAFSVVRQEGQYARRAELGGWLGKKFWGQGFATEAFKQLIAFGTDHGLVRIEARGAIDNPAVIAAGVKAGMRLESQQPFAVSRGDRQIVERLYVWIKGIDPTPQENTCPG